MARTKKPALTPEAKKYFAAAGKKGGKKRWAKSTGAQRSEAAKKAAAARWAKKKG